ncbi:hypothetical protein GMA8713_05004 [Grimontia marina]|uniref:DUF6862 domain-containing protein n=1 Tax=Grimontia marina TaxID=646534 RepID=A0A128FJJ1_9GAMM|nr:hypothetical protein GMA8713_05004 [Grimontia marina]
MDEDGKDAGNLTLETDSLGFSDLKNTTYAQNSAMGINTGVGIGEETGQDGKPTDNTEVDSTYNSSTLQYQNSSDYSVTKTLATVGKGNVTVGSDTESDSLTALNRDVENTEKDLFSVERNEGNVDVTVDHRLLTEKGRQSIKNDFVDSYEFGEDIYSAAEKLNEDDRVGLLSFWSALHNNAVGTQLKNQLIRDPENAHILAGLTSGDGDSYAQAMQELGHLAQEKFGLALTDIGLYDASKTTSTSLADNASKDVHGATVIDANNSEYGDIFIDIEGAKTLHVNSLGQELIESKTLQEGGANDETQEALSQMFGGQLEKRVDQATGNQLASTSTAEFSNSLANSQSVLNGTQKANKVGDAKVDYYLTQTEAQRKVELTDFLLQCTSADCRETDEFTSKQRELVALNKTGTKRDEDYKSACQNGGGANCNLESAKVVEAFNTYDKDVAVTDGTLSEYLDVSTKYGESASRPWEVAATDALMEMPSDALLGTLESVPELAGLAVTAASALAGDEQAQQQLEAMYLNIKGTIADPDGALDSYMADIAAREASGEITSHDAKKEVAKFYISATTAVAGQTYGLVKVADTSLDATVKAADSLGSVIDHAPSKKTPSGNFHSDSDGFPQLAEIGTFEDGKVVSAEQLNAFQAMEGDMLVYTNKSGDPDKTVLDESVQRKAWPAAPAWKEGTEVTYRRISEPEEFYMVIDDRQLRQIEDALESKEYGEAISSLGAFATKNKVETEADLRDLLAVRPDWKSSSNGLKRIKIVLNNVEVREGTVGKMAVPIDTDKDGVPTVDTVLAGGGHQIQFVHSPKANQQQDIKIDLSDVKDLLQ